MFLQRLKEVTTFIFDVDGVLTDGSILASESGEFLRSFNIKDGYALQLAVKRGYLVCIISGGKGAAMQKRFDGLKLQEVFLDVSDKVKVYETLVSKYKLEPKQVLYMGDDVPDLKIMALVGVPTCPAFDGGKTAVRDIIEKVLRVQGTWFDENPMASDSGK